jgi:hypothetical protein
MSFSTPHGVLLSQNATTFTDPGHVTHVLMASPDAKDQSAVLLRKPVPHHGRVYGAARGLKNAVEYPHHDKERSG